MVIENQIPKTEMVYEIKNDYEVPTYEEFLKKYEADGSLNYDDLSGGEVGESKGYGPCYKDCGYGRANPDCECYIDDGFVPLYLSCPAPRNA